MTEVDNGHRLNINGPIITFSPSRGITIHPPWDATDAAKHLIDAFGPACSEEIARLRTELAEVERERDLWKHQHRLDTNLLKETNRGYLSHVDALTAQMKDLKAKAAEYEAAILRMYYRIHNSQGDLQTALDWSKI